MPYARQLLRAAPGGLLIVVVLLSGTSAGSIAARSTGTLPPLQPASLRSNVAQGTLAAPIVTMHATSDGGGYWMVGSDGGVFTEGDAGFYGSMGATHLSQPIVGMAATPDGKGYWMVASDGGIFTEGDAGFYGSMGATHLSRPIVGMASAPDAKGYWMVASDGGIFTEGDAGFHGSLPGLPASSQPGSPVTGIATAPGGGGYWETTSFGDIYSFGSAVFHGAVSAILNPPANQRPLGGPFTLPPGNPTANLASNPSLFSSGSCQWNGTCPNPCFSASNGNVAPNGSSTACTSYELQAINNARAIENVPSMVLPSNWQSLSPQEQLFAAVDLERVDRGLPPYVGLDASLDTSAQQAAVSATDPSPPGSWPSAIGPNGSPMFGGVWAGDPGDPLQADYGWMYEDGWGGSASNTANIDCTSAGAPACWGHRDELLGSDPQYNPGVGLSCSNCAVGAGASIWKSGENSYTVLVAKPAAGYSPNFIYTWAAAVSAGADS